MIRRVTAKESGDGTGMCLSIGTRPFARLWFNGILMRDFNTQQRENAERLAACWNACEGIATDSLQDTSVAALVEKLAAAERELALLRTVPSL